MHHPTPSSPPEGVERFTPDFPEAIHPFSSIPGGDRQAASAPPPVLFDFHGHSLRSFTREDGSFWFVAKDVCTALGHTNSRMALGRLDDDEKGVSNVYTPGGVQQGAIISESGLFSLILTSTVPGAKAFKKWVTSEVLPSLRRHGVYVVGQETKLPEGMSLEELEAESRKARQHMEAVQARLEAIAAEKEAEAAAYRARMLEYRNERDDFFKQMRTPSYTASGKRNR